jgi:signal transduction histidine kinase
MILARHRPTWTQTIRFRLAATYSAVLFVLTTVVLGAVYLAVSRTVDAAPLNTVTVQTVQQVGGRLVLRPGEQFQAADLASVQQAVNLHTLETLRDASVVVLAGLLVASFAIGWWLAGRVLRPVRRLTAAAREISATDLSRRIALDGPHDELRGLADTLDAMLARLDGAFTAQRQLIGDASHELRNPLAVIRTTLDGTLSRDDIDADERRRAATVATRATSRMAGLIEDLLAAARRAAPAFTETDVDLAAVAADAAEEYELLAARDEVRLERRLEPDLLVIGDRDALRRAVDNLLSNALRLTPPRRGVTVATGRRQGWAFVAVRDDGPGIDPEHQPLVFDRFWRGVEPADRRVGPRTDRRAGLGLAIVRQVVEGHGGTAALHSRPGSGATFVLWLPLRPEHAATRTPTPPRTDPLLQQVSRWASAMTLLGASAPTCDSTEPENPCSLTRPPASPSSLVPTAVSAARSPASLPTAASTSSSVLATTRRPEPPPTGSARTPTSSTSPTTTASPPSPSGSVADPGRSTCSSTTRPSTTTAASAPRTPTSAWSPRRSRSTCSAPGAPPGPCCR